LDIYERLGESKWALDQLDALPDEAGLLIKRAHAQAELGRKELALSALARAGKLGPSRDERLQLLEVYARLVEFKPILEQLDALPDEAGLLIKRANANEKLGRKELALWALARAGKLAPAARSGLYCLRLTRVLVNLRASSNSLTACRTMMDY